jgi:Prenylcysteine lyase
MTYCSLDLVGHGHSSSKSCRNKQPGGDRPVQFLLRRKPQFVALQQLLFLLLLVTTTIVQSQQAQQQNPKNNISIAIIGGGIGGSFTAKYLVDYDHDCAISSIAIFEAMPLPISSTKNGNSGGTITVHDKPNVQWQGSRVTSLRLDSYDSENDDDGATAVLELGASIGHSGFHYVLQMIANDPEHLQLIPPLSTGRKVVKENDMEQSPQKKKSFGIYNGQGEWTLVHDDATTSGSSTTLKAILNKLRLAMRYNWDLVKVQRACNQAMTAFAQLPDLLDDSTTGSSADSFLESPDALWHRIGLQNLVHSSFAQFLDALGVKSQSGGKSESKSYWRFLSLSYWMPGLFGSLHDELLTAINLVNYNQDTTQVNALVGLGSFAASVGGLFSVMGGNFNIVLSAQRQANANRKTMCHTTTLPFVQQVHKRITTVVGSLGEGFTLYAASDDGQQEQEQVGQYDIVILAAPLQMARINFLVKSHVDESVLVPMPLGGLVDAEAKQVQQHEGHAVLPSQQLLPDSAKRPYTQVVTTIISNATLSSELFGIAETDANALLPASILVTAAGKAELHNMTVIRRMGSEQSGRGGGLYRTFSDAPLPESVLIQFFGPHAKVEYEKVWGGAHGGATPDYQGQGAAPHFLLYDASTGLQHHTTSGALYYPSAMELSTLASMEMSAVGAKVVAKLCAQRLGLLETKRDGDRIKDEL